MSVHVMLEVPGADTRGSTVPSVSEIEADESIRPESGYSERTQLTHTTGGSSTREHQTKEEEEGKVKIDVAELLDKVDSILLASSEAMDIKCELCIDLDSNATSRCVQCERNYCLKCMTKHNRARSFMSHETVKISPMLFCPDHVRNSITWYCEDCHVGVCDVCSRDAHRGHSVQDLHQAALTSRATLRKYTQGQRKVKIDPDLNKTLQNHVNQLNSEETRFKNCVEQLRNNLHTFLKGLDLIYDEYRAQMSAARHRVTSLRTELSQLSVSMSRLGEYTSDLLQGGSDAEVVMVTPKLPVTSPASLVAMTLDVPEYPDLPSLVSTAEKWIKNCALSFRRDVIEKPLVLADDSKTLAPSYGPIQNLSDVIQSYKVKEWTGGLVLDKEAGHVVVRTDDKRGPIKKYDYEGKLVASLGRGISGLTTERWIRGLCLDTRRGLYVAACRDRLVQLDRAGREAGTLPLPGDLRGLAYLPREDLYAVTDCEAHSVLLVSPRTRAVTRQFGKKGGGPTEFREPRFINSYVDKKRDRTVIIVSDNGNHQVKLFDTRGQYIRSYGRLGHGDGELFYPWSVCADSGGLIHVCDLSNSRVVCFWSEGGKEGWRCMLGKDELGKSPCFIDIDQSNGVLAISNGGDTNLYQIQ